MEFVHFLLSLWPAAPWCMPFADLQNLKKITHEFKKITKTSTICYLLLSMLLMSLIFLKFRICLIIFVSSSYRFSLVERTTRLTSSSSSLNYKHTYCIEKSILHQRFTYSKRRHWCPLNQLLFRWSFRIRIGSRKKSTHFSMLLLVPLLQNRMVYYWTL